MSHTRYKPYIFHLFLVTMQNNSIIINENCCECLGVLHIYVWVCYFSDMRIYISLINLCASIQWDSTCICLA